MQIIFFVMAMMSAATQAESKKRLDFNSYVQENLQIIAHAQKIEKNQLAFDELLPRTPAETKAPDFNNIKGNDSVWNTISNPNSNSQDQTNAPAAQSAPAAAAPAAAASSGENPNR